MSDEQRTPGGIDPTILRLAREAFKRRREEVGEEQALRELDANFDRTLDRLAER
jgi:hypothetical protein